MKIGIIGSGPSGWAVYQELIQTGHEITLIDADLEEHDNSTTYGDSKNLKVNKKLHFGSDLAYRGFPSGPIQKKSNVNPLSSFTKGGLSLVWGATMLPYSNSDLKDWPIHISDLDPYFSKISKLIPISGMKDDLSREYGEFISRRNIFPSQRIIRVLEKYKSRKSQKSIMGIARLAVETGTSDQSGCYYCNKCITGCKDGFIWTSLNTIGSENFIGMRVIKIREQKERVLVSGIDKLGSPMNDISFDKIYIAAGALESFRILATSGLVDTKTKLRDSATFFLPLLASRRLGSANTNSFALSQIFLKLLSSSNNNPNQYQLYEYSEDLLNRAKAINPIIRIIPNFVLRLIMKRILVAIGYLDGEQSPSIKMQLLDDGNVDLTLDESGVSFMQREKVIRRSIKELSSELLPLGLRPISMLKINSQPGEGVHSGGWLRMGEKASLLGVPIGCSNIHVVDSSILPSIAAGPITFTVMANAMRIARESQK
jgi:choline dehydrogenase-like flavoprotein